MRFDFSFGRGWAKPVVNRDPTNQPLLPSQLLTDVELNLEELSIYMIQRKGTTTTVFYMDGNKLSLECDEKAHNDLMRRFRRKIGVEMPVWDATEFDIEGLPVEAIERSQDHCSTVIYLKDDVTWTMPCSPDEHLRYVERFKDKIVANKGK